MPAIEHFDEDRVMADDGTSNGESVIVSGWPECELHDEPLSRADVATVMTDLRDALAADKAYGAVGRVQSAMHQLGIEY